MVEYWQCRRKEEQNGPAWWPVIRHSLSSEGVCITGRVLFWGMDMDENSLVIFTRADKMLAEADTIQKAKEFRDVALTAADWAARKGMGEQAVAHCRSYAMRAEIRMGEMLIEGERTGQVATRKDGRPKKSVPTGDAYPATAEDLGLTRKQKAEAKMLAGLTEEEKEKVISGKKSVSSVKKEHKAAEAKAELETAQKKVTAAKRKSVVSVCDLRVCSCAELFASGIRPDAVITDPPYPEEFLPVFTELAEGCKAADVPLVAVMSGQTYLPEVLRRLFEHLRYRWTLAYLTPGGQAVQQFPAKVNCSWKPVLLFGEAKEWIGDVAASRVNDNDKRFHNWGQSESGMADLVSRLTTPGQLVCDPFVGAGTTAVVSLALGRRFVGCDIDKDCVVKARYRVEVASCEK